jgi:hypothetical protein
MNLTAVSIAFIGTSEERLFSLFLHKAWPIFIIYDIKKNIPKKKELFFKRNRVHFHFSNQERT